MICCDLNQVWTMRCPDGRCVEGRIPGSVYSFLLDAGLMEDPCWRDNEEKALALMEEDYTFVRSFDVPEDLFSCRHRVLRLNGIDTLARIVLNGTVIGETDNMHIAWEYEVGDLLKRTGNVLEICLRSPVRYIREEDEKHHLGGSDEAMRGFPHLRKAHCMFGWDWGPRLPDQGIWKEVQLLGWENVRLTDVRIRQRHLLPDGRRVEEAADEGAAARNGQIRVFLEVTPVTEPISYEDDQCKITLTAPDGRSWQLEPGEAFEVPEPQLWWPNGLGEQPLYHLEVALDGAAEGADAVDDTADDAADDAANDAADDAVRRYRIGLRSATVLRKPDAWGETFAMMVNGRTFFAMGADYIPEDNILSRRSRERTERLLDTCAASHFNVIRVWGGGFYPDDDFYDLCDEKGLLVWQDLMFACANYRITPDFVKSITEEITQNVRRIRHHASLGLWCGNNEMEQFALERVYDGTDETAADYLIQNEYIIPEILWNEDPDTFYWPSSPSSGGKFDNPRDENRGDVHYWDVWHGGVPFTAYRKFHFRYLSEFGFQSFPSMDAVRRFTLPEDRNIFSYVMEMHQRNSGANGAILRYLSDNYLYPGSMELLIYASWLLQADAIRYGVEHFRRNRADDRCMGAVYWQLNDIWPVASWSSVDYFGNWKALQYLAKRFFAPIMLSCEEKSIPSLGRTCISEPAPIAYSARLCLCNETWEPCEDEVVWKIADPDGQVLKEGSMQVKAEPFGTAWTEELDLAWIDPYTHHLSYELVHGTSSGSVLFAPPKHYHFSDPALSLHIKTDGERTYVSVTAKAYARYVEIYTSEGQLLLEDNFFDMEPGTRTVELLAGSAENLKVRSVFDIR